MVQGWAAEADRVLSRAAIRNVLALHTRGIDRCRADWIKDAYHADAEVAYGSFNGSAHAFADAVVAGIIDLPVTSHRTNQIWIELDGDRAKAETYVLAIIEIPGGDGTGTQAWVAGRYLDRLERRNGAWKMAHRTYVLEWNANLALKPENKPDISPMLRGAHGDADLSTGTLKMTKAGESTMTDEQALAQRLDEALSREALHNLNCAYARGSDRKDRELFELIWHPDATVETGFCNGTAKEYVEVVWGMLEGSAFTFHAVSNEWFDIKGDHAVGESHVVGIMTTSTEPKQDLMTGGRYIDRYERRDGVWKFSHRAFVADWFTTQPSTAVYGEGLYAGLDLRGQRGHGDPIYRFWKD